MKRELFLDERRIGRGLAALFAFGAVACVALAVTGCITVPPGLPQAMAAPETVLQSAAKDEAGARAEQKEFFDKLSAAERDRLYGEQFDWTLQEHDAATTDTSELRGRFVTRAKETEGKVAAYDKPFATWLARSAEREAQIKDAIRMNQETLAALRYAATAKAPMPVPTTTSTEGR